MGEPNPYAMKTPRLFKVLLAAGLILHPALLLSQKGENPYSEKLSHEKQSSIIKVIEVTLKELYSLPDVAEEMTGFIADRFIHGVYNQYTDIEGFTSALTSDLRKISRDFHIRVSPYSEIPADLQQEVKLGSPDDNYGFHKVEILTGNIGYIEITSFNNTRFAAPTAIAAMNFISNCDGLIIDLRQNGGGDEDMAQFLSSFLFDHAVHLTNVYYRTEERMQKVSSLEWVPGPRMADIPVYILLSNFSYSASECFSYQLQQLDRAVIVGEQTRGGVHGVKYMSFKELSFNLKVPYNQIINPYSGTNFIDGIIPDIRIEASSALEAALVDLSQKLLQSETDIIKKYKLEWVLSGNRVDLEPLLLDVSELSQYVGTYENIEIVLERGGLILKNPENESEELVPLGDDQFKYRNPGEAHYRIRFLRNIDGRITHLSEFDSDGDSYPVKERILTIQADEITR